MSSLITQPGVADGTTAEPDPFRYGYREIVHWRPDGTREVQRVGLTLEDVLHPELGDVILESHVHALDLNYLADVFRARLASDPGALVLADCGVYWGEAELRHHSPDISVIFGVRRQTDQWPSFHVAQEGVRPRLIIEVVSPRTRSADVVEKVAHYHLAHVPYYVIVDREREEGPATLIGYQYTPRRYHKMALDERGRLWLEPLGLWLGTRENRVVCYDGQSDEELGDYTAVSQALAAETARADEEKNRADEAQARADAEKNRADEAQARAEAALREIEALKARLEQPRDAG